ncbi:MAG: hypothetical protein KAJ98_01620 [Spirochaetaceae bacterium]|nr:hypothetical protein [Spirochaetaceae bacterium]
MKKLLIVSLIVVFLMTSVSVFGGGSGDSTDEKILEDNPIVPNVSSSTKSKITIDDTVAFAFSFQAPDSISQYLDLADVLAYRTLMSDRIVALHRPTESDSVESFLHDEIQLVTQNLMNDSMIIDPVYMKANKTLAPSDTILMTDTQGYPVHKTVLFNLDIYGHTGTDPRSSIDDRIEYNLNNPYFSELKSRGEVVRYSFNVNAYLSFNAKRDQGNPSGERKYNGREVLGIYYLEINELENVLSQQVLSVVNASKAAFNSEQGTWLPIEVLHDMGEVFIDQADRFTTGTITVYIYKWPKDDRVHVG